MAKKSGFDICGCLLMVVLMPFIIIFMMIFLLVWGLLTFSGIGPLMQYCYTWRDRRILDRDRLIQGNSNFRLVTIPAGVNSCSSKTYQVFVIYMEPAQPSIYAPICIPNGLGATAAIIAQMQEVLVERGFAVLSFDRLGVGFSDINESKRFPTAVDMVREMDYVMNAIRPDTTQQWLLLGPSMGSILSQCYIALYPQKVAGFLNMDGLPYPYWKLHKDFEKAAGIYKIYAMIIWTGILRPFIAPNIKSMQKMFASKSFGMEVISAQMNSKNFYANVGLEMLSMMDCCKLAEKGWGYMSLTKLPEKYLDILVRAPPTQSVIFIDNDIQSTGNRDGKRILTLERSESERGKEYANNEEMTSLMTYLQNLEASNGQYSEPSASDELSVVSSMSAAVARNSGLQEKLLNNPSSSTAAGDEDKEKNKTNYNTMQAVVLQDRIEDFDIVPLYTTWKQLAVRVMSGRNHDFGNSFANNFFGQDMKDLAAAEHAQHVLLTNQHEDGYGRRVVYPKIAHTVMFAKVEEIATMMKEIGEVVRNREM